MIALKPLITADVRNLAVGVISVQRKDRQVNRNQKTSI